MRVQLPQQVNQLQRIICSRKRDSFGNLIDTENTNLILDTRQYTVDFGDGDYND